MPIDTRDWYKEESDKRQRVLEVGLGGELDGGKVLNLEEVQEAKKEEAELRKMLNKHFPDDKQPKLTTPRTKLGIPKPLWIALAIAIIFFIVAWLIGGKG